MTFPLSKVREQVSRPELTAADLVTYQKKNGGLSRASTVLYELAKELNFKLLDKSFLILCRTQQLECCY